MQSWINFWNLLFWLTFTFFTVSSTNFTKLLFLSEITWLVLYNYVLLIGSINDDITVMSTSFFILGFAGLEFCIGMLLIVIFKKIIRIDSFLEVNAVQKNVYTISGNNFTKINNIKVNEV